MRKLPLETLRQTFRYLELEDLAQSQLTCKEWQAALLDIMYSRVAISSNKTCRLQCIELIYHSNENPLSFFDKMIEDCPQLENLSFKCTDPIYFRLLKTFVLANVVFDFIRYILITPMFTVCFPLNIQHLTRASLEIIHINDVYRDLCIEYSSEGFRSGEVMLKTEKTSLTVVFALEEPGIEPSSVTEFFLKIGEVRFVHLKWHMKDMVLVIQ
ncbi:hypothetical protein BD770DRAFT_413191 [Pilaira anomala]|nr:hypothetical protein BD770DRAFT_413191 [Pilaira anomala]